MKALFGLEILPLFSNIATIRYGTCPHLFEARMQPNERPSHKITVMFQ